MPAAKTCEWLANQRRPTWSFFCSAWRNDEEYFEHVNWHSLDVKHTKYMTFCMYRYTSSK